MSPVENISMKKQEEKLTWQDWEEWIGKIDEIIKNNDLDALSKEILKFKEKGFKEKLYEASLKDKQYTMGNEIDKRLGDLLKILRNKVPFDELIELLDIVKSNFHCLKEIYDIFTEIASGLKTEEIFMVVDRFGLNTDSVKKGIFYELITRTESSIKDNLKKRVEEKTAELSREKESYIMHENFWSTFQYIQMKPAGTDLVDLLLVLYARDEPETKDYLLKLFSELPWGEDSYVTLSLIRLFLVNKDEDYEKAIKEAFKKYENPGTVRFFLLKETQSFMSGKEYLEIMLKDLGKKTTEEYRLILLNGLNTAFEKKGGDILDREFIENTINSFDVRSWSSFSRIYLDKFIKLHLKSLKTKNILSLWDRFVYFMVRSFQAVRIPHMGCGCILPLLCILSIIVINILDYFLGTPSPWFILLETGSVILWIIIVGATSTTHFSGLEDHKDWTWMAVIYWTSFFLMLAAIIGSHIYTFLCR